MQTCGQLPLLQFIGPASSCSPTGQSKSLIIKGSWVRVPAGVVSGWGYDLDHFSKVLYRSHFLIKKVTPITFWTTLILQGQGIQNGDPSSTCDFAFYAYIYAQNAKNRLSEYAIQVAIFKGVYKNTFILQGGKNVERCANFESNCAPVKHIRLCVLKGDQKKIVNIYIAGVQECAQTSRISHLHEKKYKGAKEMNRDQICF